MKSIIIGFINLYQKTISPILHRLFGSGCRYYPTCSDYTIEAIGRFGLIKGGFMATKRFSKCHPLSQKNYYDPVS